MLESKDPKEDLTLTAWHIEYVSSSGTAHMVKDSSNMSKYKAAITASIATTGSDTERAKGQGNSRAGFWWLGWNSKVESCPTCDIF